MTAIQDHKNVMTESDSHVIKYINVLFFVVLQIHKKAQEFFRNHKLDDQNTAIQRNSHLLKHRFTAIRLLLKSRIQRGAVFTCTTIAGLLLSTNLHPDLILILYAPLVTMLSTLSIYLMNDIADVKIDKINAPARPLASGKVKKSETFALTVILSAGSIAVASLMGILTVLLVSLYLLIGVLYSVPKVSLKDRFVIKTISIAAGGFLTSLIGSSSLHMLNLQALVAAIFFMILIFVTSPINDLADYVGDKKHGKRTIPVVIGKKNTVILAISLPFFIAALFWVFHKTWNFSVISPISLTLLSAISFIILYPVYKNTDNHEYVRRRHKKAVFLHYGLQVALVIGTLEWY